MKQPPQGGIAQAAGFVARHVVRHGRRSFVFTSARAGEGTTTTVLGLAAELHSRHGMRVLALEFTPATHGFQARLGREWVPYAYDEQAPLPEEFPTAPAGFALMTISRQAAEGGTPANGAVGLLRHALGRVAARFDAVLIDAPPVLDRAEALAAAAESNGVVLVVEARRTRLEMLSQVRRIFEQEDIPMLGSVLTKQEYPIPGWVYRLLFK